MTDYFVVCHDQELATQVLSNEAMRQLRCKILFVGDRKYDGRYPDRFIVCRDLKYNMEHMPKLVAYTGWHAIVKNNLSAANSICVLEYDVTIHGAFAQSVESALDKHVDAVGFVNTPINSRIFLDVIPEFRDYVNRRYRCDMQTSILQTSPTGTGFWPSTSNLAMRRDFLYGFVNWYDAIVPSISGMQALPFVHERAAIVYARLNNKKMSVNPSILKHYMKNSHRCSHD